MRRPYARWERKRRETSSASVCMMVGITTFMYMLPSQERMDASVWGKSGAQRDVSQISNQVGVNADIVCQVRSVCGIQDYLVTGPFKTTPGHSAIMCVHVACSQQSLTKMFLYFGTSPHVQSNTICVCWMLSKVRRSSVIELLCCALLYCFFILILKL